VLTPAYSWSIKAVRCLYGIVRSPAAEQPGEDLIVVGLKNLVLYFIPQRSVTYIRPTKEVMAHIGKLAARKAHPFTVLILVHREAFGTAATSVKNLGKAGAYQLIRVF